MTDARRSLATSERWQRSVRLCARFGVVGLLVGLIATCAARGQAAESSKSRQTVIVVLGTPGSTEYAKMFRQWADQWQAAAEKAGAEFALLGADATSDKGQKNDAAAKDDRTRLEQLLAAEAERSDVDALWIILIGHGSFDGETAKFNLRGPDVSTAELALWLAPIKTSLALIDCSSASAPLINAASAPGRVIVAATKSGFEQNLSRFGQYLAAAIADPRADLDKDEQVSLLEAHLTACRDLTEFYEGEGRLASEHPLIDDNGDGMGTPAAWFRGLRATQRAKAGASLDGLRAGQLHLVPSDREAHMPREARERRDELERSIAMLRDEKTELGEDAYYRQLEPLLVELAHIYFDGDSGAQ
jgi:hypothetical protein